MNLNMNEVLTGITLTKACAISPDNDSKKEGITKKVNVKVRFDGSTLQGVFDKALASTVISWQNGVGRKSFDSLVNNQTVEINFVAPASKPTEAPEDAFMREARAAGVDVTDEAALSTYVIKRMKAAKA